MVGGGIAWLAIREAVHRCPAVDHCVIASKTVLSTTAAAWIVGINDRPHQPHLSALMPWKWRLGRLMTPFFLSMKAFPTQNFKPKVENNPTQGSLKRPALGCYLLTSGSYPKYANNSCRFCSDGGFLCISQYLSVASEIPSWQASSFIVRFSFSRLART